MVVTDLLNLSRSALMRDDLPGRLFVEHCGLLPILRVERDPMRDGHNRLNSMEFSRTTLSEPSFCSSRCERHSITTQGCEIRF